VTAGLVLGIDIGTSSSKACLADAGGRVVRTAELAHRTANPRPGWFEHDATDVWWHDAAALCREVLTAEGEAPAAVCVSGIGPCLLPSTASGDPLRPAILYGIDTRAQAEIEALVEDLGAERILARGGSPLTSQAVGPKLLWLRRHEPETWARCRRFFMASSYLVHRLTGEYVLDHHSASQCDPLYDLGRGGWAEDWAEQVAPGLELPELRWAGEVAGHVTRAAAELTGLRAGIPVMAGTIDAWAEAASVSVEEPGDLMLMYGTTMFLVQVVAEARPDARLWTTAGLRPGTRTLAAGMATSGALTAWFRDLTGAEFDVLLAGAAAAPPGSDGLVVLPYFAGERTPLFDASARGAVLGLTLAHGRGHLYRALLEATAYGVRHNLEAMAQSAGPPARVCAVGGGTRGGLWLQIVSDVAGVTQELRRYTLGASYGDAWLAATGAGLTGPTAAWNPVVATVEPDPDAAARYGPLYDVYRELYPSTRHLAHRLAAIQEAAAR
jgi:xylulokinase